MAQCQERQENRGKAGGRNIKPARNAAVVAFYRAGHTVRETAKEFDMTPQRVGQLVRGLRSTAETIKLRRSQNNI